MKNKKITKWIVSLLTAAMLLGCMCIPALAAADVQSLNPDEKGSISLTLKSGDDVVTDGELTLYEVAELGLDNGNMAYTKTADFSGFNGDLDVEDSSLAGSLAAYVTENSISGTSEGISSDGEASFTDLTLGLYLVIQTEQSTGFYTINPFLVTVPIAEGDQWVYAVDATPKVEVTPEPEATPTPSETPEPSESPSPSETPTPTTTTTNGGGGGNGGNGGNGGTPTSSNPLPQTGQLNWPIALFAVLGVAFVVVGIILVNTGRKKRSET